MIAITVSNTASIVTHAQVGNPPPPIGVTDGSRGNVLVSCADVDDAKDVEETDEEAVESVVVAFVTA